jgi:hypothetical protein
LSFPQGICVAFASLVVIPEGNLRFAFAFLVVIPEGNLLFNLCPRIKLNPKHQGRLLRAALQPAGWTMIPKSLDEISGNDLDQLVEQSVPESTTLEYKRELPGNSDQDKKEFLADLTALANTQGGDLIFLASTRSTVRLPRLQEYKQLWSTRSFCVSPMSSLQELSLGFVTNRAQSIISPARS